MILARLLLPATLAAALCACGSHETATPAPRAALYEHPVPESRAGSEAYPGAVRAHVENDLSFRVPGKIAERRVLAGAQVKAGDVLAVLDPQDAHLNVEAARTSVAAAQADRQLADSEYQRYRDLLQQGFVSQSIVDVRENQAKLARARFDEASARLNLVQNQSGYTTLKADVDGFITAVLAEAGQVVAAGQPVMKFAALGGREVVISVPEGRYAAVREAKSLHVTLWALPGKTFQGSVREISPQADAATRTHDARIAIDDAGPDVQLGMTATVFVGEAAGEPLFRLPLSALAGSDAHPQVWVIDGERVKAVPVAVSRFAQDSVIVSGPLAPDDRVISAGAHLVAEGQVVRAVARTPHGSGT
jgi:multidrug efflux system membrane fusion protein